MEAAWGVTTTHLHMYLSHAAVAPEMQDVSRAILANTFHSVTHHQLNRKEHVVVALRGSTTGRVGDGDATARS